MEAAKVHFGAILGSDEAVLDASYAPKIQLMPGHEFLKDQYGIAPEGARATGAVVEREKLVAAIMKAAVDERPNADEYIDRMLKTLKFEPLDAKAGEFATDPTDPVETEDGKLRFTVEEGDVVMEISPPRGDFLLLHLRENYGKWTVVSEYFD